MMYRFIEIASYPGSPPTCTPMIAIECIEWSFLSSFSFKKSRFPKFMLLLLQIQCAVPSPARGGSTHSFGLQLPTI